MPAALFLTRIALFLFMCCVSSFACALSSIDDERSSLVGTGVIELANDKVTSRGSEEITLPAFKPGMWWNPNESGWGASLNATSASSLFVAWYTYDSQGQPKWYTASDCRATRTGCQGQVFETSGPRSTDRFDSSLVTARAVGTLKIEFESTDLARMSYTVAGQTRDIAITPFVFRAAPTAQAGATALWWNPSQSGWGLSITEQTGTLFAALYVYDRNGAPAWYTMTCEKALSGECSGKAYRATGPAFGPTHDPTRVAVTEVGTMTVTIAASGNSRLSYMIKETAPGFSSEISVATDIIRFSQ